MKRNIILSSILLFFIIGSYYFGGKIEDMLPKSKLNEAVDLENKKDLAKAKKLSRTYSNHRKQADSFLINRIMSENLINVPKVFDVNLALKNSDNKNKEASVPFLDQLTDIIHQLNIEIVELRPGKKSKRGTKNTFIPYEMELNCTFEQFASLINDLEKNKRLIVIDEFRFLSNARKLSKKRDSESVMKHRVELTVSSVTLAKVTAKGKG